MADELPLKQCGFIAEVCRISNGIVVLTDVQYFQQPSMQSIRVVVALAASNG